MALPKILYSNILASGVTATDTETDYSVDNIYDLRTYTYWQADTYGTKYITMDAGGDVDIDALGIVSHNLGTASATVSLEHDDNSGFSSPTEAVAGFSPSDDTLIFKTFTQVTERYWRIKIVTAAIAPRIGVAILGEAMEFPVQVKIPHVPITESVITTTSVTKAGAILGTSVRYKPVSFNAQFVKISESWVTGTYKTFWDDHGALMKPFFWAVDTANYDAYFVQLSGKSRYASPITLLGTTDSLSISMQGVAE